MRLLEAARSSGGPLKGWHAPARCAAFRHKDGVRPWGRRSAPVTRSNSRSQAFPARANTGPITAAKKAYLLDHLASAG